MEAPINPGTAEPVQIHAAAVAVQTAFAPGVPHVPAVAPAVAAGGGQSVSGTATALPAAHPLAPVPAHVLADAAALQSAPAAAVHAAALASNTGAAPADPLEARLQAAENRLAALENNARANATTLSAAHKYFNVILKGRVTG